MNLPRTKPALAVLFWRSAALVTLGLGGIGILLPGLPTVPFWILSAYCAGRGWPAVEDWLLNHPRHGGTIRQWREQGAVPRRAKWAATLMMCASSLLIVSLPIVTWAKFAGPGTMLVVAIWLWRRPEP